MALHILKLQRQSVGRSLVEVLPYKAVALQSAETDKEYIVLKADPDHEVECLTRDVVCTYLQKHVVPVADLAGLVEIVHAAFSAIGSTGKKQEQRQAPAVPIKKSIRADTITCLDCGRKFRSLRRHVLASHGLSVDGYKAKWELPADYPMVAPDYAKQRSTLAKQMGLGRRREDAPSQQKKASARRRTTAKSGG